jgi:DNA polymerase III subunit delta'
LQSFFGNQDVVATLQDMLRRGQIAQTLLFSGPEGVGKATLARQFGALLLGDPQKIDQDDLSLEPNAQIMTEREKWTSEKRNEDPLLFASHPDFVTFAPDGPLRQISIHQMRLLKDRAPLKPLKGNWRVFLIDQIDRANEQAANSLLKTLEEPPPHLILILTARNPYDLLPTIRSRAVSFRLSRLSDDEMRAFLNSRSLDQPERRARLAEGSPGLAISIDLEAYDRRRVAMFALLKVAAGIEPFGNWLKHSDAVAARRTEKLDSYLDVLYILLEDVVRLSNGVRAIRNDDLRDELETLAARVSFNWIRAAVAKVDELVELVRRNIQKSLALDAFAVLSKNLDR